MNRGFVVAVVMLSVALGALDAAAAPAAPITVKLTQSDGTVFKARPKGDEYSSWMEALDGHTVVKSGATWYYAITDSKGKLVPSALRVGSADASLLRAIPKGLHPADSRERITGPTRSLAPTDPTRFFATSPHTQPLLVILMEFNDRTLSGGAAAATTAFSNLIFGASNSVKDYYDEISDGNFNIVPATESYGTANDGIVVASYGANHPDPGSNATVSRAVVSAGLADADPFINFATFDTDLNFNIFPEELSVIVIFAGYENAYGGANAKHPNVWGHKWTLNPYYLSPDDQTLTSYTAFGELHATVGDSDNYATIGIMCHELGHLMFGLPDLYDTDSSSYGIGNWCSMASGAWNGLTRLGDTPAYLSAWGRVVTGMLTPTDVVSAAGGMTIQGGTNSADIRRLWGDRYRMGESFLIENRRRAGYDDRIPAGGMLIWHIDESVANNADDSHRLVDLEEADGLNHLDTKTNSGDGGDPFPGTSNKTTFNGSSNPNSDDYWNADTGIAITSISASAATMTANLMPRATGDNIRYDESGWTGGTGYYPSNVAWTALRVTNDTTSDQLEGIEVCTSGFATIDVYIYQSMNSNTPTTLLASTLGCTTSSVWDRIFLASPVAFPPGSDLIIVLKIDDPGSGGFPICEDITAPYSGRCWRDADGAGAFQPSSLADLNQVALVGPSNVAPTITAQSSVTIDQNTSYTIQLSNLTVTDPDDSYPSEFTLAVGTGANYTVSGATVTPTTNYTGALTVPVSVNDGQTSSPWFNFAISVSGGNVPPTVLSSNRVSATPTKLAAVNFTVTFSESVVGVNAGDFSLTTSGGISGAAVGTVSGTGAVRTVSVTTGTGSGTIRLDVLNDGTIDDLEGTGLASAFSSGQTYTIDKTPPSVVLTSVPANPTGAGPVSVTATFSEPVTGFVKADVTKTNAAVLSFAGSGAVYTFVLDPTTAGTSATAYVAAGKATDLATNSNTISNALFVLENVPPTVLSSNRVTATPSALATVQFTVTFSQAVTGVDASDFSLTTTGGIAGASIGTVSGSGAVYTVSVGTGTGGGTIQLNVLNDGTIKDLAGNSLAAAFSTGQIYTISKTPPTVVLTSVPASPAGTAPVDVTATFSESVTGFGSTGIYVANATLSDFAGSGAVYTFVLTPTTAGTSATAYVAAGKAIDAEGDINTTASNILIVRENVSPTVVSSNRYSATPTKLTTVKFTVTFSESVTGVNAADFSLTTTGGIAGAAVGTITASGAVYTVSVGTGTGSGTIQLNVLNDGSIKDPAGNALASAFSGGQIYTIDKTAPSVVLTSAAPNPTTTAPFLVTVTFSEPVTGFVATDITKTNATVSGFSGSGAVYTFMLDPIAVGTATATVAAGKAKDLALNNSTASNLLTRTIQ